MAEDQSVCCPEFNPALWNEKNHIWDNKLFLKDEVKQIFHFPLNINQVMTRLYNKVHENGAQVPDNEVLFLFYDPSPWKSEVYATISKDIPGENVVRMSGTYVSKVFDGTFNRIPEFMMEMNDYLAKLNRKAKKMYFHYAYCPKCAKKFGHNYIVAFAEV